MAQRCDPTPISPGSLRIVVQTKLNRVLGVNSMQYWIPKLQRDGDTGKAAIRPVADLPSIPPSILPHRCCCRHRAHWRRCMLASPLGQHAILGGRAVAGRAKRWRGGRAAAGLYGDANRALLWRGCMGIANRAVPAVQVTGVCMGVRWWGGRVVAGLYGDANRALLWRSCMGIASRAVPAVQPCSGLLAGRAWASGGGAGARWRGGRAVAGLYGDANRAHEGGAVWTYSRSCLNPYPSVDTKRVSVNSKPKQTRTKALSSSREWKMSKSVADATHLSDETMKPSRHTGEVWVVHGMEQEAQDSMRIWLKTRDGGECPWVDPQANFAPRPSSQPGAAQRRNRASTLPRNSAVERCPKSPTSQAPALSEKAEVSMLVSPSGGT
ncbi:hypothetical protein B0H10DRAFT_2187774 [Mycena sp. CBHHK59/15]|nr:hypothetical protein B0H10DRAFT_2187774 [Mycena sp. CBHHK59/15]